MLNSSLRSLTVVIDMLILKHTIGKQSQRIGLSGCEESSFVGSYDTLVGQHSFGRNYVLQYVTGLVNYEQYFDGTLRL